MALLEVRSVSFAWPGGRNVLDAVDLRLERGQFVALVGPNGAGKTTALDVCAGLLRPRAGAVLLDGDDVHALSRRDAARRIAGVAVEGEPRFPFTVRETVALGRHPWRGAFGGLAVEDEARIDEALAETDLLALADRPLTTLSSGERQRAALARGLAQGGEVLLLDEPTSHLDLGHRLRVLEVVRRRASAGGPAVLAALHDLNLAAAVADRVVLLVEGRVVASGIPGEVLTAEIVAEAFGARVHVVAHPVTGGPVLVPDVGAASA